MQNNFFISLISVFLVSLVSLIGIVTIPINTNKLKKILIFFISFSAGALLGDVFIHIIPELIEKNNFTLNTSLYLLSGIIFSLFVEKIIQWRHCHMPITKNHIHNIAYMSLFGDLIHNFIDGLIIAASFLTNIQLGIATTIAVVLHEIPQEIGDFGILLHSGFTKKKALIFNFLFSLSAILGVIFAFYLKDFMENSVVFLNSFAAGTFIYIASSDLIPELHKDGDIKNGFFQIIFFILGIAIMMSLLLLE